MGGHIACMHVHKGRDHSKDLSIDRRIILKWILGKGLEVVDWILVAQVRDWWQAVVKQ
jgi:hypothetical protein